MHTHVPANEKTVVSHTVRMAEVWCVQPYRIPELHDRWS